MPLTLKFLILSLKLNGFRIVSNLMINCGIIFQIKFLAKLEVFSFSSSATLILIKFLLSYLTFTGRLCYPGCWHTNTISLPIDV